MNKVALGAEVGDMHGPNSLVTKSDLTNTAVQCQTCQQQRLTVTPKFSFLGKDAICC